MTDADGPDDSGKSQVNIVDSSHYITSTFSTGVRAITNSATVLRYVNGNLASGATVLARRSSDSTPTMVVVDFRGQLVGAGRPRAAAWYCPSAARLSISTSSTPTA